MPRLRLGSAALGTLTWAYWWWEAADLGAKTSTLWWLASLSCWSVALFTPWRRPRPTWATAWSVAVIVALMVPRLLWLEALPYQVASDEICYPLRGLTEIPKHLWDLGSHADGGCVYANYLAEALQVWPAFLVRPLLGVRLASGLYGFLSLLATYALARRLGGKTAAAVGATVLACSYWHIVMSRTAYPNIVAVLVVCVAVLAVVAGAEERNYFLQFAGGALTGVSFLVYDPARVVVPIVATWLAHWLFFGRHRWWERALTLVVVAFGATLFLSPYQRDRGLLASLDRWRVVAIQDTAAPVQRFHAAGGSLEAGWNILMEQLHAAASVYVRPGAWIGPHDLSADPIVDPISLTLALAGLALAAGRPRDSHVFLPLTWAACTFFLGQVVTPYPFYRMGVVIPALALAAGLAGAAFDRHILARGGVGRLVRGALLVALLGAILPVNLSYVRTFLADRSRGNGELAQGRFIATADPAPLYYIVALDQVDRDGLALTFQFLSHGHTVLNLPSLQDALCAPSPGGRDVVFVLDPLLASAAASLIQRHYPTARVIARADAPQAPPAAVAVSAAALNDIAGCRQRTSDHGLLARYFQGRDWQGALVADRIEEWPFRWHTQADTERFGSIEWSGLLTLTATDLPTFVLLSRLPTASATVATEIDVPAGASIMPRLGAGTYPLRVRCQSDADGSCSFLWSTEAGIEPIPLDRLQPPAGLDLMPQDAVLSESGRMCRGTE